VRDQYDLDQEEQTMDKKCREDEEAGFGTKKKTQTEQERKKQRNKEKGRKKIKTVWRRRKEEERQGWSSQKVGKRKTWKAR
jgi:hypothetical protein